MALLSDHFCNLPSEYGCCQLLFHFEGNIFGSKMVDGSVHQDD